MPATLLDSLLTPPPRTRAQRLLALALPRRCVFCGSRRSRQDICPGCAGRLRKLQADPLQVEKSLRTGWMLRGAAIWQYAGVARQGLLRLKYGETWRANEFIRQLCLAVDAAALPTPDLIVFVPDAPRVQRRRPYCLPQLLAEGLARHTGAPVAAQLLIKPWETPSQHDLSRRRRQSNLAGAFTVTDPAALQDKTVWLVDDVVTTGATMRECSRMLWLYGAKQVVGISCCTTPADPHPSKQTAQGETHGAQ